MRISDCSSDVCSSDLLRVADRGRLALAPEGAHLGALVQIGVGDDRARGLDELPMSEHIDERSGRHVREAGQRRLAAPAQGAETLRPFPVAIIRIGRAPTTFVARHPFLAARSVIARLFVEYTFLDRPHPTRLTSHARK